MAFTIPMKEGERSLDVFQIVGKLVLHGKEQFGKDVNEAKTMGTNLATGIGKALSTAAKVGAVAVGACATAVSAMTKASLDSFAQYEQLVGGSQLLFGDAYAEVAKNAKNAYKEVQMSQNDYLQQVNGFATGLKTALGGNEQAAAELAHKIIKAEADVVAATGNSQEAVQNAFNGIMKSNFTMLDNLQLGITPTKEGFQTLINEVNAYNSALGNSTNYQISNLADCQAALVDYIAMKGLADYATLEAAGTIQGSLAMTKAAWQNFLTGFADSSQDLDLLLDNLVESATNSAKLIVPKIAQILGGISTAMGQIMPVIAAELPALLEQLLPGIISGAVALVNGLIMALPSILQILIEQLPSIITQIAEGLAACFPILLSTVTDLFGQIWDYIALELLNTGMSFEDMTVKAQEAFSKLWEEIQAVWESLGQPIWDIIESCVDTVKNAFSQNMPEIKEFVSQCFSDIKNFWENNLKPCFEAIGDFIESVVAPVFDAVFSAGIVSSVENGFEEIRNLWNNTLMPIFTGITDFITGVFSGDFDQAMNGLANIANGVLDGIATAFNTSMETAKDFVINAINKIKEAFNFSWSLPHLKLPHVEISGSFSLNPPSVPSFGISWYKKAYDEAMVLNDPTIFGFSAASGKMLGGGEGNGNEVVAGESHLMSMIQEAVSAQNETLIFYLQSLVDMLAEYFPQVIEAAGHDIVTNDGVIVARYAPMFNTALGKISRGKDRGR